MYRWDPLETALATTALVGVLGGLILLSVLQQAPPALPPPTGLPPDVGRALEAIGQGLHVLVWGLRVVAAVFILLGGTAAAWLWRRLGERRSRY